MACFLCPFWGILIFIVVASIIAVNLALLYIPVVEVTPFSNLPQDLLAALETSNTMNTGPSNTAAIYRPLPSGLLEVLRTQGGKLDNIPEQ